MDMNTAVFEKCSQEYTSSKEVVLLSFHGVVSRTVMFCILFLVPLSFSSILLMFIFFQQEKMKLEKRQEKWKSVCSLASHNPLSEALDTFASPSVSPSRRDSDAHGLPMFLLDHCVVKISLSSLSHTHAYTHAYIHTHTHTHTHTHM